MKNQLCSIASVCALVLSLASLRPANAAYFVMSGGEPGEGFKPFSAPVYAYHYVHASPGSAYTMQGSTFLPFYITGSDATTVVGSVKTEMGTRYTAGGPDLGSMPDDNALEGILNGGMAYGRTRNTVGQVLKVTFSDLAPGGTYQLDLFWRYQTGPVPATYTITDATGSFADTVPGIGGTAYDVRNTIVANASGQVVVVATNPNGSIDTPYLNAFSITVPEPASVMVLGFAGIMLAMRRSKRANGR